MGLTEILASIALYVVVMFSVQVVKAFPWQTLSVALAIAALASIIYGLSLYFSAPFFFPCEPNFYVNLTERLASLAVAVLFWWGAVKAYQRAIGY